MKTNLNLVKYGLATAIALVAYFLILHSVGLSEKIELRMFNFLILLTGIILAIKAAKKKEVDFEYLRGFGVGFYVTVVATVPFAIFIFGFLELNEPIMTHIINNAPFGHFLSPWACGAVVLFEGLSSGVIITYTAMQYFKKSNSVKLT